MKQNKINPVNVAYKKLNIYKDLVGEKVNDKLIYDIFNKCNAKHNRTNYVFSPIDIEINK